MKNHCTDCHKLIDKRRKRCRKCYIKWHKIAENNSNYIDGRTNVEHYCMDCNKIITYQTWKYGNCRCKSCEMTKRNKLKPLNNSNNPNFKGGKPHCKDCGKQLSNYGTKRCSKCARKGKLHPNYKNGSSLSSYSSDFNDKLKESIRKRDNYECQNCGMTEEEHLIVIGYNLTVHHIDYIKINCKEDNLITLCNQCNIRANYNREYWKIFYQIKMKKNINA